MKKIFALFLLALGLFVIVGCKKQKDPTVKPTEPVDTQPTDTNPDPKTQTQTETPEPTVDIFEKGEGVMTYEEYCDADIDSAVVIEGFIQGAQTFNPSYGNLTLYLADKDGAYFVYRAPADQELADKCVVGAKVKVSGTKSEWSGETEIINATIEVLEGSYIAQARELDLSEDYLEDFQNQLVVLKEFVVLDKGDDQAFLYKYNGSGSHDENSDLYYDVTIAGELFTFVVESDLCDNTTAAYAAVENLKVGDIVNVTGFLYWYEGPQLHTTGLEVTGNVNYKDEGVLTYAEFAASAFDKDVVIEGYIQGAQVFVPEYGNITLYLADASGAYFVYRAPITAEEVAELHIGDKVKVTGVKAEWSGEVEVTNGKVEKVDGPVFFAPAKDITKLTDEWDKYINQLVTIQGLVVQDSGDGQAFLYKWNGSGSHDENSDLYYKVELNDVTYTFVVESDLCNNESLAYRAVEGLHVGDKIIVTGFLYWYENPQLHTLDVVVIPGEDD